MPLLKIKVEFEYEILEKYEAAWYVPTEVKSVKLGQINLKVLILLSTDQMPMSSICTLINTNGRPMRLRPDPVGILPIKTNRLFKG